jgi:hypothetical protein
MVDKFDDLLNDLMNEEELEKKGSKKPIFFVKKFIEFENITILADHIVTFNKEQRFDGNLNRWLYCIVINKNIESKDIFVKNVVIVFYDEDLRDEKYERLKEIIESMSQNEFYKV